MAINFSPEKAKFKNAIYGKDVRSALVSMADKCQELADGGSGGGGGGGSSSDAEDMIARQFSNLSSVSYSVGDHVIYNDALYVCRAATTGGTFNSNAWRQTIVTDEIEGIEGSGGGGGASYSDLLKVIDMISHGFALGLSAYQYNPGDYTEHDGIFYKCIAATTGETFDSSKWSKVYVSDELQAALNAEGSASEGVANVASMIAPAFDPEKNYSVGNYVTYNGMLYICIRASTGAFSNRNWQSTTISSKLITDSGDTTTINSNLKNLRTSIAYPRTDEDSWKAGEYAFGVGQFTLYRYTEDYTPGDERAYNKQVRLAQDVADLRRTIAPEHDNSKIYVKGDIIYYDNGLYRKTANSSGNYRPPVITGYDSDGNPIYNYHGWEPVTMTELLSTTSLGNLASIYDPNRSDGYHINDVVYYDGGLKMCTFDTSSPPGDYDSWYWTPLSLGEYVGGLTTEVESIASILAEPFDWSFSSKTYSVGDYVTAGWLDTDTNSIIYKLYKCISATTGQQFDENKWVQTTIMAEIKAFESKLEETQHLIANDFDSTEQYEYGDIVIFNGLLWICTASTTVSGDWSYSNWTRVTIAEVLKPLIS